MEFPRNPILVTGGAGYIGSVLVRKLIAAGKQVRIADALFFGDKGVRDLVLHPLVDVRTGDLRNPNFVQRILQGVKEVVHLAAIVGDPACAAQPEKAETINSVTSRQFLLSAQRAGVRHFIFSSTCSNYGVMQEESALLTEDSPLNPVSLYARQKVAFEKHLLDETNKNTAATILRFATAYGVSPRMRFDLTVNHFTRDLALGKPLQVFGQHLFRPYAHISDLSDAIIAVLEAGPEATAGRVYNVGHSDENYSKQAIVDLILKMVPSGQVQYGEGPAGDVRNYRVDFSRIANELKFSPARRVPDGIAEVYNLVTSGQLADPFAAIYQNV